MTWFKKNKFLAGLLCITTLIAGLLVFLGMKFGSSLEEVQGEIATEQSANKSMKSLPLYPTIEGAKEKRENFDAVIVKANEAREKLIAYRPESLVNVSGKIFSENLNSTVDRVKELFPGDALPKGFNLGFEAYSGSAAKEGATGILTYQLAAMESVFKELDAAGVKKIQNLVRPKLPAEKGEEWADGMSKKPRRGKAVKSSFEKLPAIAHRLPFELTFRAPERAARQFLTKFANSNEYFFETRIARIQNPAPIPTGGKAPVAKAEDSGFGEIEMAGEEKSMDDKPVVSEQILNKISGGDDLVIYLRADLLLFIDEQKFPELN